MLAQVSRRQDAPLLVWHVYALRAGMGVRKSHKKHQAVHVRTPHKKKLMQVALEIRVRRKRCLEKNKQWFLTPVLPHIPRPEGASGNSHGCSAAQPVVRAGLERSRPGGADRLILAGILLSTRGVSSRSPLRGELNRRTRHHGLRCAPPVATRDSPSGAHSIANEYHTKWAHAIIVGAVRQVPRARARGSFVSILAVGIPAS